MSIVVTNGVGQLGTAGANWVLIYNNKLCSNAGGDPLVVHMHGHGQDALIVAPGAETGVGAANPTSWFETMVGIANAGFLALALEGVTTADWGNNAGLAAMNAGITAAQSGTNGFVWARPGKVGLSGYSMGGIMVLNYLKLYPSTVACVGCIDPGTNLDFFESSGSFPDVDTAYGGTSSTYATQSVGHKVYPDAATVAADNVPIKIWHLSSGDTTIPYSQSQAYQAAINATTPGLCTLVDSGSGNHAAASANVGPDDYGRWFAQNLPFWNGLGRTPLGQNMGN